MTSKLVTTLAAFVFAGGLASAARAADTGPGVPPPPAQGPATTGNDAMMGGAGKPARKIMAWRPEVKCAAGRWAEA